MTTSAAKRKTSSVEQPSCLQQTNGFVFSLAAKPHRGLAAPKTDPHQDPAIRNLRNAEEIEAELRRNRIGVICYGDEITSTSNDREKFGTYTRDSYTGLDYAQNRYYASSYGRFNTPDPFGGSIKATDPGSWNRYSYTRGDPVNRNDRTGLCDADICVDAWGWGEVIDDYWDYSPAMANYAMFCMFDPICFTSHMPSPGGGVQTQGNGAPVAVTNVQPLVSPIFGQLASALQNTPCGQWFQAGLTTSAKNGQSLSDYLTTTLPAATGTANFVGGNANALEDTGSLAPGYGILFNNNGAFFKQVPQGQTIAPSNDYATQFAAIQGGSPQAEAFLMLHEVAHLFGMIRNDNSPSLTYAQNMANQAFNNDEIWVNCSSVIQGFSNKGP
ncbi:MAG TPA: RHS repeat-associated core domain-containing protein [Acidobacteriaceae bacterium]|nr:RHS repeat-associated core domain-containing protein [Acidobacteriaceae bacterium]